MFSGPQPEHICFRLLFLTELQMKKRCYWILAAEKNPWNQSGVWSHPWTDQQ